MNLKNQKQETMLPGLNYTGRQLFWVGYGRLQCTKFNPDWLFSYVKDPYKPHSPGPVRLQGVLQNSPDFANDFKCHSGSVMNPYKQCPRIW